jgi:deoxyribodipyrimidine photo-lyase
MNDISLFWLRRDLRLSDNMGLYQALTYGLPVLPVFIFDANILSKLENKEDARVTFIFDQISKLKSEISSIGGNLLVAYGNPVDVIDKITDNLRVKAVFTNKDYEPYAVQRDFDVKNRLFQKAISFHSFKDHVIFEEKEILSKSGGTPYTVFTPYSKSWKEKFYHSLQSAEDSALRNYHSFSLLKDNLLKAHIVQEPISLESMSFKRSPLRIPPAHINLELVKNYTQNRDFPYLNGTSRLGIHLRFGTIGIRELGREIFQINETFLNELIWRDFYSQILFNFPFVERKSFKPNYDAIQWRNNREDFECWKSGNTGFPLVDAGMRELNATGFMHNRIRMLTASFLTKNLLIDWRWGEHYFAEKLLDFDLASNNGGWQWAAGSGTDAAPYFRIFSPEAQTLKFDSKYQYIKKWIPEFGTRQYANPIIDIKKSKERCLSAYQQALKNNP